MPDKFIPSYVGLRHDLIRLLPEKPEKIRLLDIGCSTGVNGKYLLQQHPHLGRTFAPQSSEKDASASLSTSASASLLRHRSARVSTSTY